MDMLSLGKAAQICAVTRWTLWSYVKAGELPASRTPGGHYRVSRKDLDEFIHRKGLELEEAAAAPPAKAKILVVDDDPVIRKFIIKTLEKSGHKLEEAEDGFEAGQKTIRFKPNILIVDIFMPRMDGFEVCRRMKENPETNKTKIMAISGFDTEENRRKIIEAGADWFMPKPLSPAALRKAVTDVLQSKNVRSQDSA